MFSWSKNIIFEKNDVRGGSAEPPGSQKCQKCEKCVFAQNLYGLTGAKMTHFGKNAKIVGTYLWDVLKNGRLFTKIGEIVIFWCASWKRWKRGPPGGPKMDPRGIKNWSFLRNAKTPKPPPTLFQIIPIDVFSVHACVYTYYTIYTIYSIYSNDDDGVEGNHINDQIMISWFHENDDFMKMMISVIITNPS